MTYLESEVTRFWAKVRDLKQKRQEKDPELSARYLPSSGSEGMDFEGHWCEGGCGAVCRFFVNRKAGYSDCTKGILIHQHGRADYADRSTWHKAWREIDGRPTCTAYKARGPLETREQCERAAYEEAMRVNKSHLKSV